MANALTRLGHMAPQQNALMQLAQAAPEPNALAPLTGQVMGQTAAGRPRVSTSDGGVSTERSVTEFVDGAWRNLPTMFGGREVPVEQAVEIMRRNNWTDPETGEKFWSQTFQSVDDAVKAAEQRSNVTLAPEGVR